MPMKTVASLMIIDGSDRDHGLYFGIIERSKQIGAHEVELMQKDLHREYRI